MIRHRYSKFNEDLADDYINLSAKTNKQNNNIEGILQKDYEKFENGIKLKNGSLTFGNSWRNTLEYTVTFKNYSFSDRYYSENTKESVERILKGSPSKFFAVEVFGILDEKMGYQEKYDNMIDILDFIVEICEKETEIKDCLNRYLKYYNDKNRYNKAYSSRDSQLKKSFRNAQQEVYDNTPDISENAYALWHSKNGDRIVTVLSIDEPNHRAKINTDKGATMYVPLDTLDKDTTETEAEFRQRLKDAGVW